MTVSLPYVVFGVTGRTGAAAADALLRAGPCVSCAIPPRASLGLKGGARVAVADLTDLAAMTSALCRLGCLRRQPAALSA
jgi:nucleoside-diphosphate-sugar epimerase